MTKSKLNHPWSANDLKIMRSMAKAGASARACAERLGRSRGAVAFKAMNEQISFRSIKQKAGTQSRPSQRRRLSQLAQQRAAA